MATKTAKKVTNRTERFNVEQAIERVKATSQDVNKFALETTEDLVNETIARMARYCHKSYRRGYQTRF